MSRPTRYDVIDLDPYGSVSPFIDAAVQATGKWEQVGAESKVLDRWMCSHHHVTRVWLTVNIHVYICTYIHIFMYIYIYRYKHDLMMYVCIANNIK